MLHQIHFLKHFADIHLSMIGLQVTDLPFFAIKVRLGRGGAEELYQLGPLNEYER